MGSFASTEQNPPHPPVEVTPAFMQEEIEKIRHDVPEEKNEGPSPDEVENAEHLEESMRQIVKQRVAELREEIDLMVPKKSNRCSLEKEAVLKCYEEEGKTDPMKCAQIARTFYKCSTGKELLELSPRQ